MKLIFFAHPDFIGHKSMPRFARMLSNGMAERGYDVAVWQPVARWSKLSNITFIKKWLGYIDQYLVFPRQVRKRIETLSSDTLFVFTDQALGPWVPLVADRPHVIHCHDFIALQSALGETPQAKTSWTGRKYQQLIRKGFSKGKNFISVSHKTREDLHRFLGKVPVFSEVVYNGLHQSFFPQDVEQAREVISAASGVNLRQGYVLHVGGNIWYKNRLGVVEIYEAWRSNSAIELPLVLVGEVPSEELSKRINASPFRQDIIVQTTIGDSLLVSAYSGATVMLFPSIDEGFGWPIAEAMAAGTLVITTGQDPMSEVAGSAGFMIERKPVNAADVGLWAANAATILDRVVNLSPADRARHIADSIANAQRFTTADALDKIENIYCTIAESA